MLITTKTPHVLLFFTHTHFLHVLLSLHFNFTAVSFHIKDDEFASVLVLNNVNNMEIWIMHNRKLSYYWIILPFRFLMFSVLVRTKAFLLREFTFASGSFDRFLSDTSAGGRCVSSGDTQKHLLCRLNRKQTHPLSIIINQLLKYCKPVAHLVIYRRCGTESLLLRFPLLNWKSVTITCVWIHSWVMTESVFMEFFHHSVEVVTGSTQTCTAFVRG